MNKRQRLRWAGVLMGALLAFAAPRFGRCGEAASEQADWKAVVELDGGPQITITSREQARKVGLEHLAKREEVLRAYLARHNDGVHTADVQLRLVFLLASRGDLLEKPEPYDAATRLLDEAAKTAPEARQADFAFAKITLAMRRIAIATDADREFLKSRLDAFQRRFPSDRRLGPLIVEIATLYDTQPHHKRDLLHRALEMARTEELRARILDDLKRLEFLGQPVAVTGTTSDGTKIDIAGMRGKVVLVYFFAGWSAPSIAGLDEVAYLRRTFPPQSLAAVGVNLDSTKEDLQTLCQKHAIDWPVIWESQSWESPLVRSLAVNALPTLWILDKHGNLRTLNARTESEGLVRSLLKEK